MSEGKELVTSLECAIRLRIDKTKMLEMASKAKDFPAHEAGGVGRATKLYDYAKVRAWYMAHKKGLDDDMAQMAIRGKIWPVLGTQFRRHEG